MIRILFFLLLINYYNQSVYAQKNSDPDVVSIPEASCSSVDELSSYLKQNFATDTARVRAIYVWITNHINYDVVRMQEMKDNPMGEPQPVADVLKSRKAVCQGYADLFTALCKNVGINALFVGGYVKNDGKVMPMAHAWVAAQMDGEWFIFDPTWGSGYLSNNQFFKHFSNAFYKQSPKEMIVSHMPFDPLYQFLSHPISNREFIDGIPSNNKVLFNFNDSLTTYNQLSSPGQMAAELRRMEGAGIENDLLQARRQYLKKCLQSHSSNNAFDEAGKDFSRAIILMHKYVDQKNKQFSTIGDNDLLQSVDSMKYYIKNARSFLSETVIQNNEQQQAKTNNLASTDQYWKQLEQEEQFVKKYIDTEKALRKLLFIKR